MVSMTMTLSDMLEVSRGRSKEFETVCRKAVGSEVFPESVSDSNDDREQRTAGKQLMAATQGSAYTAIRPLAAVVSSQPVSVGIREVSGALSILEGKLLTKTASALDYRKHKQISNATNDIKQISDGIDIFDSHPIVDAIRNPNEFMTQYGLMSSIAWSLAATGEAYVYLDVEDGRLQLYYFPRPWITPKLNGKNPHYEINLPNRTGDPPKIPADRMAHFIIPHPLNPMTPLSMVQAQSRAINTDDELQAAQYASMKNITKPGMMVIAGDYEDVRPGEAKKRGVTGKVKFTKKHRAQIRNMIRQRFRGAMHNGDPIVLDRLISDVKPYMSTPAELDFPGGASTVRRRVETGMGTPEIVTGRMEDANRATSYVAQDIFFTNVVNPMLSVIGQTLSKSANKVFSIPEGMELVVLIEKARPRDADLMISQIELMADAKVITGNEIRNAFGMEQREDLHELVTASIRRGRDLSSDASEEEIKKALQFFYGGAAI